MEEENRLMGEGRPKRKKKRERERENFPSKFPKNSYEVGKRR